MASSRSASFAPKRCPLDQKAEAARMWPDSGNPKSQEDKALSELRKKGFLRDPSLTEAGWAQAETLGYIPSARKGGDGKNGRK
jgi:hypothetical protein